VFHAAALATAALLLSLAIPLLTGRLFITGDFQGFHIPLRLDYQQALRNGDSILWTPSILSGYYLFGEGQIGMLHPLHQLLYRLFPLTVAMNLEVLANYLFACTGMFWLLRRFALERAAALFGAMLFAFCGFNLLHLEHVNVIAVVAHVPWLLAATDMLFASSRAKTLAAAFPLVTLLFTSEILLGFPQAVWWSVLAAGSFAVLLAARARAWTRLALFAGAGALSLALGAIQVLPSADMAARSIRPLLDRDFALTFSLHPFNVLQLWSPYVFIHRFYTVRDAPFMREFGIYSGAVLMVMLPWLWIRRSALARERWLIVSGGAFALAAFVMALGRYGGVAVLLARLPVLDSLRAPARTIVLCQFALALLAAIAFADVLRARAEGFTLSRRDVLVLCLPAALSLLTTVALNAHLVPLPRPLPLSTLPRALAGNAMVAITTALVVLASRDRRAAAALVLFCALDLGMWGVREAYRVPPLTLAALTPEVPPPTSDPGGRYAFSEDYDLPGNLLLLKGYRLATGYVGLPPATIYHVGSDISRELSGAHWVFKDDGRRVAAKAEVPRARLLDRVRVTDDFRRDVYTVDLHTTALLDHDVGPLQGPPGRAVIVEDRPGRIVIDVDAPGRQLLSVSERHHPGWHATVDGRPIDVVAVHADFIGGVVDAGRHRVEFTFMPRSFVIGRRISIAAALVLLAAVMILLRRT
jgi:hypothetical protein